MDNMSEQKPDKFEILRHLAVFGKEGGNIKESAKQALEMTCSYVNLNGASLYLWDNEKNTTIAVSHADSIDIQNTLNDLEQNLFENLRKNQKLISAYMSFGGDSPKHTFTLPLMFNKNIFGAVIGIQAGSNSIVAEDRFLDTLSAMLALCFQATENQTSGEIDPEVIDKERLSAILETAVTVNHEVNNPLQAIIGNIQLLLMKKDKYDDDIVTKLKAIEESAIKINTVTQKLMRMTHARSKKYSEDTNMLDLSGDDSDE